MAGLGPHGGYILAAYAATLLILGWMVVGSLIGRTRAEAELRRLEAGEREGER